MVAVYAQKCNTRAEAMKKEKKFKSIKNKQYLKKFIKQQCAPSSVG